MRNTVDRLYRWLPQPYLKPIKAHLATEIPQYWARLDWAADWVKERELESGARLIHPVWFPGDPSGEGWSVVVTLKEAVARGDRSSLAMVHFLVAEAPQHYLKPGAHFDFSEGRTLVARILLGEGAGFVAVRD